MKRLLVLTTAVLLAVAVAYAAKPASVRLIGEGLVAQFLLDKGGRLTVTEKGTPLPAGTYTIKALSVFKKDEKGKVWEVRYCITTGEEAGATLIVDAEQDKVVDVGPPVSIQGWTRQGDPPKQENVRFGFGAHGRFGRLLVQPMAFLGGRAAPPPTFKVVTLDGKVIHQGVFAVNSSGAMNYDWKPGAFKGKYKLQITATFGPFEWSQANPNTEFEVK